MCGFVGIVNHSGFNNRELEAMTESIRHRGPDDEGYFITDLLGPGLHLKGNNTIDFFYEIPHIQDQSNSNIVGLGHRRLSIIDLYENGHQPMVSDNGNVIVYNGEVYNYIELKRELKQDNVLFKTDTDTEVVLKAYEKWGEQCVKRFVGMWSFCIYDINHKVLFCSRDRFSIKPFYYYHFGDCFLFASEVKALLKSNSVVKKISHENLYEYFVTGKISNTGETLFSKIKVLPAGTNLTYNLISKRLTTTKYYNLKDAFKDHSISHREPEQWFDEYSRLLNDSIRLHLRSDVEIGTCLSGGLDSSSIVQGVNSLNEKINYKTFSAVYSEKQIDESGYIDMVVSSCPNLISYRTIPSPKTLWDDLGKIIWHQDFPIASTSVFAQWEVMKLAKESGIKVLLDGQGADESLGGYSYFTGAFLLELLSRSELRRFYRELKHIKTNRSISVGNEVLRALLHTLPGKFQLPVRSKFRSGAQFFKEEFRHDFKINRTQFKNTYQNLSIDALENNLPELLRYEDRNSMAFSIESRVPFLDHRLVEFSLAIPLNIKIYNGWSKYALRRHINGKLPDPVVWRKDKMGFVTPQLKWTQELSNELYDFINESGSRFSFLNLENINDLFQQIKAGGKQGNDIWKLISLIKWLENIRSE